MLASARADGFALCSRDMLRHYRPPLLYRLCPMPLISVAVPMSRFVSPLVFHFVTLFFLFYPLNDGYKSQLKLTTFPRILSRFHFHFCPCCFHFLILLPLLFSCPYLLPLFVRALFLPLFFATFLLLPLICGRTLV